VLRLNFLPSLARSLNPRESFRARLALTIGSLSCLLLILLSLLLNYSLTRQFNQQFGQSLAETAYQMADKLDRGMFERYREIQILAANPTIYNPTVPQAQKRSLLETLQTTYLDYAWIGLLDSKGTVMASTNGILQGQNIATRPVFQEGIEGVFVGDVHEAVLLAKLLPNPTSEPMRFVDVAAPVVDDQGVVRGVLAAHLSWQWADGVKASLLQPLQNRQQVETLIIGQNNVVLLGPPDLEGKPLEGAGLNQMQTAIQTNLPYWIDRLPNQPGYLVGFKRSQGYRTYPGLGWMVLVRQPLDAAFAPIRHFQQRLLFLAIPLSLLFAGISWWIAGRITRAIRAIATAADAIRQGESTALPIKKGRDEISRLSYSLYGLVQTQIWQKQALQTQNTRLQAELQERQQAEMALHTSEERLNSILDSIEDVVWSCKVTGELLYLNPAAATVHGCPLQVFFADPNAWIGVVYEADRDRFRQHFQALLDNQVERMDVEYRVVQPGGEIRWLRDRGWVVKSEGRVIRVDGIATDITQSKQVESVLRESEEHYRLLFEANPQPMWVFDPETLQFLDVNESAIRDYGYSRSEFLSMTLRDLRPPEDLLISVQPRIRTTQGFHRAGIWRHRKKDGTVIQVEMTCHTITLGDRTGELVLANDVTTRLQAEIALRESQQRLDNVLSSLQDVVWSADSVTLAITYTNPVIESMYGVSKHVLMQTPNLWTEMSHPEDREWVIAANQQLQTCGSKDIEYRIVRPDGEIRWLRDRAHFVLNETGDRTRLDGIITDITASKVAEATLQETNHFLQAIIQSSPLAIYVMEVDGQVRSWNPSAEKIFGWGEAEVIGRRLPTLTSEQWADFQPFWQRILQGESIAGLELSRWRRDGTPIDISLSTAPITDANGEITGVMSVATDITDRKRAELALRQSEEHLQFILQNMPVMLDVFDEAGNIIVWNQECERVTGYQAKDILGNPNALELLYPDPNYRQGMMAAWAEHGNNYRNWEWELVAKDGTIRTIAWSNISDEFPIPGWSAWGLGIDVTERVQIESKLRRSEGRYRCLVEASSQVVWVTDDTGCFTSISPRWTELTGQTLGEIERWGWLDCIHPEDRQAAMQTWMQALDTIMPYEIEFRVRSRLGTYHDFWVKGVPVLRMDGTVREWVGTYTDVSRLKQAEAALRQSNQALEWRVQERTAELTQSNQRLERELQKRQQVEAALRISERKFKAIFNQTFQFVGLLQPDGTLQEINQTALNFIGVERADVLERPFWEAPWWRLSPAVQNRLRQAIQQAAAGKLVRYEEDVVGKDDRIVTIDFSLKPLRDETGKITLLIPEGRDISDRKQAEEQLRQSNERMSLANAELARAARLKDEFMANMSHELRTPLNAILGLSEALLEEVFGTLTDRQRKSLKTIESSGKHLLDLINDILDLSKIESGRMELQSARASVTEMCDSCITFVKQLAHQKSLQLSADFPKGIGDIEVDERRIRQALINLLSNAIKFTPEGGQVRLEVIADVDHETIEFSVVDTGIGIAPEHFDCLFKPFIQLDSSLSRRYSGTGLGLALVRRIAELHGGSVALASEVGKGSRFTISLPWRKPDQAKLTQMPLSELQSLTAKQAFVVEDSTPAASQIARYLSELAISVTVHPHGEGAFEQVLQRKPDLVILDLLLPHLSGWDVLTQLKSHPATQTIPVLVVSVMDEHQRATEQGAAGYLVKPITRQQFQSVIRNIVSNSPKVESDRPTASPQSTAPHRHVLLAEDNEANVATLLDYLEAQGYSLTLARNGLEAVEKAKTEKPDLILMDIQMPDMDGLEATQRIRAIPELMTVPIIALTALAMPGDRERCLSAGANDYLTKPVSLKKLKRAIEALSANRSS